MLVARISKEGAMHKGKLVCGLAGLVFALAVSGGVASAHSTESSVIVFSVENLGDASADCSGALFGLSFDMASPGGPLLGHGVSCVHFFDPPEGCPFGMVGCRDAVHATFTLTFARGTLTAPIVLSEHWLTESTVLQIDRGTVTSGSGEFNGATGSIFCAGTVEFAATSVVPNIVCAVRIS
jgi:hypothetical protein